jgi:hypothetical protein
MRATLGQFRGLLANATRFRFILRHYYADIRIPLRKV